MVRHWANPNLSHSLHCGSHNCYYLINFDALKIVGSPFCFVFCFNYLLRFLYTTTYSYENRIVRNLSTLSSLPIFKHSPYQTKLSRWTVRMFTSCLYVYVIVLWLSKVNIFLATIYLAIYIRKYLCILFFDIYNAISYV